MKPGEDLVIGGVKELDAKSGQALTCAGEKPHLAFLRMDSVCVFLVFLQMKWSFQTGSVSPPKSFLLRSPLCSLVFVPLLSNLLRPGGQSLRGGIFPPFLSGELGCKRMNWINVKVPLREKRKKFLIVGLN